MLRDPEHKKMIWQDNDITYYPQGINNPDYCVLRFTATSGRYYATFKSQDFLIR